MVTFKKRLKASLKSFINPDIIRESNQQQIPPTPSLYVRPIVEQEIKFAFDNQLLSQQNVLITGAGQNIGKNIALEMAKQGANIYFTDIIPERITALEQELSTYAVKYKGYISDISKMEDSEALCQDLIAQNITIDVLVNNVGIQFETMGIDNLNLQKWQTIFTTNVFGPLYLTRLIWQRMIEEKIQGSLIFITSIHQQEISRWPSYSASKAALAMTIKEIAVDLAPHGIRVNAIAPAAVNVDEQGNPFYLKHYLLHNSTIPPHYIGRAAVYLASDYFSKYTTGTTLTIDAGVLLYNSRVAENPPT
jgi:NAD(P)-dependent dehydrogenase (short-subunit alcohol dehydrogenase family)